MNTGFVVLNVETMKFHKIADKIAVFEKENSAHSVGTSSIGLYTLVEVSITDGNKNLFEFV